MKRLLFLLLFTGNNTDLFAQKDTSDNYVNRFISIPPIKIYILPDSTLFTNENIKKNTPFLLMFFTPDCDHCQKEIREIVTYKNELKGIQILMVSTATFPEIKKFYDAFALSSMQNVKLGRDINSTLGSIYKLTIFPSIFVYDGTGVLAKAFVGNIGVPAILAAIE